MLRELIRALVYCVFALGIGYLLVTLVEMLPAGGPLKVFLVRAIWVIVVIVCIVLIAEPLIALVP